MAHACWWRAYAIPERTHMPACRASRGILGVMTVQDPSEQWWVCCWGHVFSHPPVGEGEEISCPGPDEASGVCGTFFIYEPYESEQDARAAFNDDPPNPGACAGLLGRDRQDSRPATQDFRSARRITCRCPRSDLPTSVCAVERVVRPSDCGGTRPGAVCVEEVRIVDPGGRDCSGHGVRCGCRSDHRVRQGSQFVNIHRPRAEALLWALGTPLCTGRLRPGW